MLKAWPVPDHEAFEQQQTVVIVLVF